VCVCVCVGLCGSMIFGAGAVLSLSLSLSLSLTLYIYLEKGIQYNYLDMTEMPDKTMTYLRMFCNSFPIVLNINHSFSNFEETLHILITFELFL